MSPHCGQRIGHVVVEDLVDGDALLLEIAELVGEMHRPEADPDRIGAGHDVGLADRRLRVARRGESRNQQHGERQPLQRGQHGFFLPLDDPAGQAQQDPGRQGP
jgi:hypothetical protein